jgi:hypothetical protein
LRSALSKVGFQNIEQQRPSQSNDPHFDGIDRHGEQIPVAEFNLVETMVLEATK